MKSILVVLISLITQMSVAQPNLDLLDCFKWKNRLVIIATKDSTFSQRQIELLSSSEEVLRNCKERKLIWILANPEGYQVNGERLELENDPSLYEQFQNGAVQNQTILIGLDGSIKLRSIEIVTPDSIFKLIDSMPMRRRELNDY